MSEVEWSSALVILFIYFIHLIIFNQGSLSRKAWSSNALWRFIEFICISLGNQWSGDHYFCFPIRTGKGKWCPFIISSLAFIPVNQRQKCHLTHFSPPVSTHPMHVPGLDAAQVSKWACSIRNYWYSYCHSQQGFSNQKIITNIKFIAKWVA